jgi:hypothetical protein
MREDYSYLSSELILVRKKDNLELMKLIDDINSEEKEREED